MTERLTEKLSVEAQRLSELKSQQETFRKQIEEQERQLRVSKAGFLSVGPETVVAYNADTFIKFANEHNLNPQWLARQFLEDAYFIKKSSDNWSYSALPANPTDIDHHEYAIAMIRKSNGNVYSRYRQKAMDSLKEAQRISGEQEPFIPGNPGHNYRVYYKFLQENIGILLEVRQKQYLDNF